MKLLLMFLVSFVAITAIPSGLVMILNPNGRIMNLSLRELDGTPFNNFLLPGIALALIVGGSNLLAVFGILKHHARQYYIAFAGGIMISGFIVVQMILMDAVSWLHFLYFGTGILIFLLAYRLEYKIGTNKDITQII